MRTCPREPLKVVDGGGFKVSGVISVCEKGIACFDMFVPFSFLLPVAEESKFEFKYVYVLPRNV